MDPTAPKDNPTPPAQTPSEPTSVSPNSWSPQPLTPPVAEQENPQGPIMPGQFVSVGGDIPSPVSQNPTPLPPIDNTLPPLPETPPASNGPILGATPTIAPEPTLPPLPPLEPTPMQAPPPIQPNPTPYVQPPGNPAEQVSDGGSSKIKKLRIALIVVGVLVLIAIIAALVWFFILGSKSNQAATTQSTVINQPSPSPITSQGSFGNLSQATPPATQSTASATPSASKL